MNILEKIVAVKREEVATLESRISVLEKMASEREGDWRDFALALQNAPKLSLIAEVKKASPSAGVIRADFNPVAIATEYERAGASAISVLTDAKFFQGSLEFLEQIREKVSLPLLRKDFIIDDLQILEAKAYGADAILLIAAILDDSQLRDFRVAAESLGLATLVEVHDAEELERALRSDAPIIGINNRNLKTFEVDLHTTEHLAATFRSQTAGLTFKPLIVAESGINSRADAERVAKAGVNAILVGESLMRSEDIAAKVKELLG